MKKITMVMMALLLASGSAWATDNIAVFGSYWNTKDLDWGGGGDVGNLSNEVGYYGLIGLEVGHAKSTNFFAEGMYRKIKGNCRGCPQRF